MESYLQHVLAARSRGTHWHAHGLVQFVDGVGQMRRAEIDGGKAGERIKSTVEVTHDKLALVAHDSSSDGVNEQRHSELGGRGRDGVSDEAGYRGDAGLTRRRASGLKSARNTLTCCTSGSAASYTALMELAWNTGSVKGTSIRSASEA